MPTRRSHSNSHHGCMECKRRRVKCDQQQPKCARCVRRNSECTYRHLMTNYNPFQTQQAQQALSSSSISTPPARQIPRDFRYVFHSPEDSKSSVRATDEPVIKAETPTPLLPSNAPPLPAPFNNTQPDHTLASSPLIKTEPTSSSDILAAALYLPKSTASVSSVQVTDAATESTDHPPPFSTDQDAFLMQHFKYNLTTPAMSPIMESNLFSPLNAAILQYAQTTPYVTHVVLAFSGLHLASFTPSSESTNYLYTALAHKDAALRLFMPAIAEGITAETAEPQLVASAVLVACCLALPAADPGRRMGFDRIDILAEVAGLFQGSNHIFKQSQHTNKYLPREPSSASSSSSCDSSSSASQSPRSPGADVPWTEAKESLKRCFDAMQSVPPTADPEEQDRMGVLIHAFAKLEGAFDKVERAGTDWGVLCAWLGMVKPRFVTLISKRDPVALLLLGHWAVCRTNMDNIWWARGWPATTVAAIFDSLDESHRPLLSWCMSQAGGRAPSMGHHQLVEVQAHHHGYAG